MQRAKGFLGAVTQTGSVVAYSIGGIIAADLTLSRMTITIAMGAIAVTTAAALSFRLNEAPHVAHRDRPDSRKLLATSWRSIRSNPDLMKIIALSVATHAFGAHLLVFYQQYFLEIGVPGVWFGLALSIASVGVVIAQFYAWKLPLRIGTPRAMLVSTLLPGLLYLVMAWNGLAWLAVVLFVIQWTIIHLSGPLFSGLFNIHLPDDARATSLSLINAATTVYIGLGGIILGWLANQSLPLTFALIGIIIVVAALIIRLDNRHATTPLEAP
jgi:predicted MFS family arabinose efflux permease